MNLPVEGMEYGKMYTIDMTGEVLGSKRKLHYVNVPIDVMKEATIKQLKAGEPVWFGCDVLQDSDFVKGILSLNLYDVQKMFGIKFDMDKGERFQYNQSLPTHAMTMAGVDLDADGKPIRWKVENSWGTTAHGKPVGHCATSSWMIRGSTSTCTRWRCARSTCPRSTRRRWRPSLKCFRIGTPSTRSRDTRDPNGPRP